MNDIQPLNATSDESCDSCHFSYIHKQDIVSGNLSLRRCRRYPPPTTHLALAKNGTSTGQISSYADIPPVQKDHWCGEYKRKPSLIS